MFSWVFSWRKPWHLKVDEAQVLIFFRGKVRVFVRLISALLPGHGTVEEFRTSPFVALAKCSSFKFEMSSGGAMQMIVARNYQLHAPMYTPTGFPKVVSRNIFHHQKSFPFFLSKMRAMTTLKFVQTIEYFAAFADEFVTSRELQV